MIKKILETRSMISPVRAHRISALRHPHARAHTEMVDKDTSDPKHTNRLAGCHMRVSGPLSLWRRRRRQRQQQVPVSRQDDEPTDRNELCVCKQQAGRWAEGGEPGRERRMMIRRNTD